MADNKLTTQFNKVDLAGLASAGSAPVNIGKYKSSLNEAVYAQEAATARPYDYDAIDWAKDWFTTEMVSSNNNNYDSRLGDIILLQDELDDIDKSKKYINNQKEISNYLNALREDPTKLEYKLKALNLAKENDALGLTDAYNKTVINKAGGLDNQKIRLDLLENDNRSKIDTYLKEAQEYKDKANYWENKHKVSDFYKYKELTTNIDFTNPDTYLFSTADLIGSSASSWKSQLAGTIGAAIASSAGVAAGAAITAGSGGVALPLGIAVAGAGVSVASNIYSRSEESKAEVFSNYKSRVFNNADNAGITDKVLENAKKLLIAANKNNPNYELPSDDEIKDKILVGELKSGNEKFDDIRIKSLKGLDNLYTQNMALSGWDIAENAIQVMPIGALAKGSKVLGKLSKVTSKATGLKDAISKRIDDVVMAGIDRVPTNLARITKRKAIASIAGRTVLTGIGEGAEEGTQYIRGKEYERGAYDDREDNYLEAIVGNVGVGARSVFAALTPFDSAYSSDKEFLDNFKGGALLGGLTTAVVSPLAAYKPLKDKIRAEELVSKLYADRFAERDAILKSEFYAEAAKNNKAANIYDAFEELKKMNIEGADLDAINAEQERANRIINLASSRQIKELAIKNNIDPKSDDYNTFVALYDHHTNLVQESIKNLSTTSTELSKILQRQDVNEFAEQKNKENPELVKRFAYLQALKSKLEQLSKKYADDISLAEEKSNANGVNIPTQDLHENKKIVDGMLNQTNKDINHLRGKELNEEDSANFNINDYEIPTAHDDMAKAVEAMIYSNIDNVRNLKGLLNFVTSESEDKGKAKESVDKYKETVEENELVIQDLNDAIRGNIPTQEQVKEEVEVKQPVVEPLPAQEVTQPVKTVEETAVEPISKPSEPLSTEKATTVQPEQLKSANETKTNKISFGVNAGTYLHNQTTDKDVKVYDAEIGSDGTGTFTITSLNRIKSLDGVDDVVEIKGRIPLADARDYKIIEKGKIRLNESGVYEVISPLKIELVDENTKSVQPEATTALKEAEVEAPEITELRKKVKEVREWSTTTTKVQNKYNKKGVPQEQQYSAKVEPSNDTDAGRTFNKANLLLEELFNEILPTTGFINAVNNRGYRMFPQGVYNEDAFYNELSKVEELTDESEIYLNLRDAKFKLEESILNNNVDDINKYTDEVNTQLTKLDSLRTQRAQVELKANEEATEPFAADKQPEVPVVTTDDVEAVTEEPVAENIPTTDSVNLQEVNKPLVMDRGLDKWSRQLQYFTPANTTFDGYSGYESGVAFGEALMNPDFLATAEVSVVVKPYTNKTTNVTEQAVYIEFKYKDKNYVAALHSDNYNFGNIKGFRQLLYEKQLIVLLNLKALREKIIKLNEIVKNNPNYKIVPTSINKTNGVINSVVDKEENPVNTNLQDIPLFNINNIYDITPENTPIGIATGPLGSEVIRVGGKELYANGKLLGAAYYMLPVNANGKTFIMPIRLNTKPFKGDNAVAELILKLVTDLNNPNYTTADGEVTPFSHFGLLKLIVNFGSHTATNPEMYSPDLARERTKKQFYIDKDDSEYLVLGQDQYRLADLVVNPDGTSANKAAYDKAKQYIMDNFHWSVEEDNLWKWFAGENTLEKGHPLGALKAWFQINDKLKLTIIPGELEFTKDDVTANGSGISMVGWYIKNNILTSNLNPKMPFKNPNIYMLDVMLVNDTENKLMQAATEKIEKEVAKVEEAKETGTDSAQATDMTLDDIFADLGPNYGIAEPVANNDGFINKEYATNYLKRVLGLSEDDVIFVPTIIEITRAGFYVLGRASLDSITLSEQAPAGVEYHEAWHRVSNLLISENKRKKIFKRINKDGRMTEAEIDEILAELFRDFMNYALNKIDFETTNWFRKIYNFIKTFAKVGNYRLAKMYYDINVGRFSNVKPSTENVERFKRIYEDGPDFKHRGTSYATIRSSESYNTMISSLFYALLRMNFGNIYNVRYEDLSKLNFDVLRTLISNQYTKFNNPAMKEILDNFDNDIAPAISDLIAKLGGSVKLEIEAEEQALSDIEGGETESINVGEHTKASYETSIVDKAPYKIKFFFKTVPAYVFNEANNKVTVATDPITGLPRFVDSGMAWKMALNKLHDVRSVSDMINRINQLSQTDRFFLAVAIKLNQLDPIKDEQFMTKLYTIIRSSKHEFLTGKITTLPNKKSKVDIIDNTVDVRAIAYPKIWSQMLFYNSTIFRVAEDGVVYADVDALLHLRKVRERFYKIYEAFISGKGKLTLGDKQYDFASNLEDQERLKKLIVMLLNEVGVAVDLPTIANMMSSGKANGYSDPLTSDTYTLLKDFITSGKYSLKSLFDRLGFIASSVKDNGSIDFVQMGDNKIDVRQFYNESGFIKALAQSYAKIHAGSEDLKSLGASNNILYPISLNNFVFDRVAELNEDALVVNELNDITYNKGSLMLSQLASRRKPKVSAETLVNFRTDDVGDQGRDYFQITDREDYIIKMSLVMSDRILFPTTADKKTYHVLNGFKLPHERITWEKVDCGLRPTFGSETIAQLMAYANAELATIEQTLNDLDPNNPNRIPNDKLIKNYHTPVEYKVDGLTYYVSPNGTRFRLLTGIYIVVDGKELFIDFNAIDKSKTPELALQKARLNLQLAKDYFFNSNIDGKTKADFISTLIAKAVEKEINKAAELGLILKLAGDNIYGLRNSLLDNDAIETRTSHYLNLESAPDIVKTNAEGYAVYDAIADYAVNSIISINEVERIFSGDPAFYKWAYTESGMVDNTVDKIKRLGSVTSTGTNNRLDFEDLTHTDYTVAELNDIQIGSTQYTELEELFTKGNIYDAFNGKYTEEDIDKMLSGDTSMLDADDIAILEAAKLKARAEVGGYSEGINIADAAVYVSPTMYRNMMRMIGEWSPEVEEAFQILTNPETELSWYDELELYRKVTKASLKPLKYMAFGFRTKEQQGLGIPYFNKMALFPVFKTIATGDMADLYERMTATGKYSESNPIDMVMFNSAVKVGSRAPKDYYANGDTDVTDLNKLTVYKQPFKYLRQQLATDPHVHEELMAGTQFLKVGLSNIDPKAKYGNDTLGYMLGEQIANSIFEYMNILSDIGKLEIYDKLFDLSGNLSIEKLGKMLSDDAKQSDMNDNVIDALLVIDGKFKIPLSAISGTSVDNRFISMLNKAVIDIHLAGGSFIQRSSFGIKAGDGLSVISDKYLNGGKRLKLLNKDGSMDAIVSINLFKHIIPDYNKKTFKQAKDWLIDNNIIGENAEPNAIGYRIPTQSIASISPLKFVDVLPEVMGDTVILPDEFTKLTGSDFDIDKLYIARYQYKNGSKKGLSETDTIKNAMLEMYMRILTTVENTNQLKASIDTATGGVKAILKDIEHGRKLEPVKPFMPYLPSFQEDKKSEYTKGKSGIGPMALNNAHHVLTQLQNCRFKSNPFVNALGIRDLNKVHDDASLSEPVPGRVLDWLSAMINAFVDIAKDPYIVRLNVNDYTYNMISLLLRTGKGKQSFYFLSQPILKDIAIEVAKNKGRYGVDLSKTNAQLERDAIDTVLRKYDPSGNYIKQFRSINYDDQLMAGEYADLFTEYTKPDGTVTSRTRELLLMDKDDITQGTSNYARELIRIYFAFKALKPYADELANLVKYSKIDTKKMGNTFAQQRIFAAGIELMKKKSLFEAGDVSNFFDKTFLQRKYENSILFGSTIFKNILLTNTDGFLDLQDVILQQLGRSTNATERVTKAVINALSASIKSGFFNERMAKKGLRPRTMFYGSDSMAKRLLRIKNNIQKGIYEEFKDGNTLLDFLLPNIVVNSVMSQDPDLIDTSSIFTAENTTANDLINSWLLMLESDIEEVRLFADDLVDYAFITSGDNKNPNSFFEYFPIDFRLSIGYADYVSRITDIYAAGQTESFNIDDIYLNNWYDDALVKRIPEMYYDTDGNTKSFMTIDSGQIFPGTNRTYPLVIFGKRNNAVTEGKIGNTTYTEFIDENGLKIVKPAYSRYIKVKIGKTNNPESWAVYKLVGVSKVADGKNPDKIHEYPVYQVVNKKGYKYRGHTITEYGRNDWHKFNILPELYDFKSNMQSGLIVNHIAGIELMNPGYWSDLMGLISGTVDVNDNNAAIDNKSMTEEEIDSIEDVEPSVQVPTIEAQKIIEPVLELTKLSGLDLVDMYVAAEKQLREELTQLGLDEADITTKFNEFATILRNNNINTKDAIFEALRKYICNL